ncbi:MAG: 3-methyl-2-oxobutanoate hydroxymethyltransferase [Candidatus Caenarcaniphilales bacterium]|nr:3-methyl-2-oxobutanoate hydroxymethyltransferase [Candidatus Caenarcaniphilales bacterium]
MPGKEDFKNLQRIQIPNLLEFKEAKRKIVCLTAYDFRTAQLLDESGEVDLILVGDSLANVFLGLENTYEIGMAEMLYHTKAVARGTKRAILVSDMPFMSYQVSPKDALENAAQLIKIGAKAVKVEGASNSVIKAIEKITEADIPVIGHIGYTPQSSPLVSKTRIQGKSEADARTIFEQARSVEQAGAVAIVLEMMPADLANQITTSLKIPTIGIGAGVECDGQILVIDDLIGRSNFELKFVKKYSNFSELIKKAAQDFASDVREKNFPEKIHSFSTK